MSWNYRVIRFEDPDGTNVLAIHEVYYDLDGETPIKYSENPAVILTQENESSWYEDLERELGRIREALDKPILNVKDFDKCSSG